MLTVGEERAVVAPAPPSQRNPYDQSPQVSKMVALATLEPRPPPPPLRTPMNIENSVYAPREDNKGTLWAIAEAAMQPLSPMPPPVSPSGPTYSRGRKEIAEAPPPPPEVEEQLEKKRRAMLAITATPEADAGMMSVVALDTTGVFHLSNEERFTRGLLQRDEAAGRGVVCDEFIGTRSAIERHTGVGVNFSVLVEMAEMTAAAIVDQENAARELEICEVNSWELLRAFTAENLRVCEENEEIIRQEIEALVADEWEALGVFKDDYLAMAKVGCEAVTRLVDGLADHWEVGLTASEAISRWEVMSDWIDGCELAGRETLEACWQTQWLQYDAYFDTLVECAMVEWEDYEPLAGVVVEERRQRALVGDAWRVDDTLLTLCEEQESEAREHLESEEYSALLGLQESEQQAVRHSVSMELFTEYYPIALSTQHELRRACALHGTTYLHVAFNVALFNQTANTVASHGYFFLATTQFFVWEENRRRVIDTYQNNLRTSINILRHRVHQLFAEPLATATDVRRRVLIGPELERGLQFLNMSEQEWRMRVVIAESNEWEDWLVAQEQMWGSMLGIRFAVDERELLERRLISKAKEESLARMVIVEEYRRSFRVIDLMRFDVFQYEGGLRAFAPVTYGTEEDRAAQGSEVATQKKSPLPVLAGPILDLSEYLGTEEMAEILT